MAASLIVGVRRALIGHLAEVPHLEDLQVSLGWASSGERETERIFTVNARFSHAPASLKSGRTFRNEKGAFDLIVHVEGVGDEQETTSLRALEIGGHVEEWIADNRSTLATECPGLNWLIVSGEGRLDEMHNDHGSLAQLAYPIAYDARLT